MSRPNPRQINILLVDDTPDNLRILSKMMEIQGYEIRKSLSGQLALKAAQVLPPDLILLDINLPDMNGYEVCEHLKADPKTREIPIIFVSALDQISDKIKAFEMGGVDYITKPFHEKEVLVRISTQLMLYQQKQQLKQEILERQKVEERLRHLYQREQTLNRVIQVIRNSLDLSQVFATAVLEIGNLLLADWVYIVQYLPEEKLWRPVAEYVKSSEFPSKMGGDIPDEFNIIASDLKQLKTVCLNDPTQVDDQINPHLAIQFSGAWLMIPLQIREQVWGSLTLIRPQQLPWKQLDKQLAYSIADHLSLAIYQSEMYEKLEKLNQELQDLANLDGLTHVANRRRFDQVINHEWLELAQKQLPLSLILADVDYFKDYNDYCGHLAGDDCLRQIAQAINQAIHNLPATDRHLNNYLVARYGGEEFVVLLPNTELSGAQQIAQLIQSQIQQLQIPHIKSLVNPSITLSLGVGCVIPRVNESPNSLIAVVDQALYAAKNQGRNRIVLSDGQQ